MLATPDWTVDGDGARRLPLPLSPGLPVSKQELSNSTPAGTISREAPSADVASRLEAAFVRLLARPRLALGLAVLAVALSAPSLFIGFHLDDFVARYIYSDLVDADKLYRAYAGGYGIATGDRSLNHWQVEAGYAPWWMYEDLFVALFRPIPQALHMLDVRLWPDNAVVQHAHNLVWLALLVVATTRMYRGALGPVIGGMAALLFAVDHTHGFIVGYICNRHSLVTAILGVLCLDQHIRYRSMGDQRARVFAPLLYAIALASGESTIAMAGYLFAYALFVEKGSLLRRLRTFAPYFAITLLWRVFYNLAGYGARGSGLYIDPVREPVSYLLAFLERGPILMLGQFLVPPAETYVLVDAGLSRAMLIGAVVLVVALAATLAPLIARHRMARFWALGMLFSLVPATSTYPHNRQLLFTSFGAMALLAELWHLHAFELKNTVRSLAVRASGVFGAMLLFGHLIISPVALPLTSCSIAFAAPLERAAMEDVGSEASGKDAVFVTAPDYFAVRLVQLHKRIEQQPLPRRFRALSFGPQPVTVRRSDDRTLIVDYEGGILGTPFMELFRDRRLRMSPGDRVTLAGLEIEVLRVTDDGRASSAQFRFDAPLEAPSFVFYYWANDGFMRFYPPPVGDSAVLPAATLRWALK